MLLDVIFGSIDLTSGIFWMIALVIAITVHEFMHAWTANYLGDDTAKMAGRISLNPIAHLDPIGTLAILFLPIGWGKPVPVNERHFKNPRAGSAIVSLAGPLSNLFIVAVFAVFLRIGPFTSPLIFDLFKTIVVVNVILLVFNLVPIPPLDGSKILYYFFPSIDIVKFEVYGPIILLGLLFLSNGIFTGFISVIAGTVLGIFGIPI